MHTLRVPSLYERRGGLRGEHILVGKDACHCISDKHPYFLPGDNMQKVICGYCNQQASLVYGDCIYPHLPHLHGKQYYLCQPCGAWVGCHGDTDAPLGTPAKLPLRIARSKAHTAFDALWRNNPSLSRKAAYRILADYLAIPPDQCHIGHFNENRCAATITFVNVYKSDAIDT